jgi:sulfide dehydrogenase [flavocytochrome c] flavoprotein subunit
MNHPPLSTVTRRRLLGAASAGRRWRCWAAPAWRPTSRMARVVVIGAGFGGATAAKYIRKWEPRIEVTLVERNEHFVSCPISNLVLVGRSASRTSPLRYDALAVRRAPGARRGHRHRPGPPAGAAGQGRAVALRPPDRRARHRLPLRRDPGPGNAEAQGRVLHAWKAGPQTVALRRSWKRCPTAACSPSASPRPRTAARRAPTNAPAWSRTTSSGTSRAPRC